MHQLYSRFLRQSATTLIILLLLPTILKAQQTVQGVVRLKVSEVLAAQLEQTTFSRTVSGEVVTGNESLDRINRQFRVHRLTRVFPHAGKNEARHRRHGLHLWYEASLDKTIPVTNAIQSYQSDQQILRAEPVYQKKIIGSDQNNFGPRVLEVASAESPSLPNASNDPLFERQWHYNNTGQTGGRVGADIGLLEAWKVETGNPNVVVAVTDGGIDTRHPDLVANLWVNAGEIPDNNIDDDNNGYVDDIHGYGFVNKSGTILPHDHGTHVAGTIAAVSNNGTGVAGIAGGSGAGDGVRLMSCAVFANDSVPDGFAEAYVYSADNGAAISQNSWGYTLPGVYEQVVLEAIDYFIAEAGKNDAGEQTGPMNGGLAIFSAGNFNDEGNYYPAFYKPVIAVAATTHEDIRAHYSNYGTWVDISAPGGETDAVEDEGVLSTLPGGQYGLFMGTSMACPHVSGVAALVLSKYARPGLRPDAVRERMLRSVDDIYALNPSFQGKLGSGRLQAALALETDDPEGPEAITDLAVLSTNVGEITLTWTSPRDEGDFAADYDLGYSTSPITASTFGAATRAENIPAPAPPGTTEQFTISNLPGGTRFYFAILSRDFEGNASALSNVVSEMSALTPTLVVTPLALEQNLRTAEHSTATFSIANEGAGPLKFSIDQPATDDAFARVTPDTGELGPGTQKEITASFDASEKFAGTYHQQIVVNSNDPASRTLTVELTLHVTNNGAPIASIEPVTVDFKSVQTGQIRLRNVQLYNAGSETLRVHTITSDNAAFSASNDMPLEVAPFTTLDLRLAFSPSATGLSSGTMTLSTNDPAHEELTLAMKGEGLQQSPIVVTPPSFNETVEQGTRVTRHLTLTNNASQPQAYRLEVMNTQLVSVAPSANRAGREKDAPPTTTQDLRARKLKQHQDKFVARKTTTLAAPVGAKQRARVRENESARKTTSCGRPQREYVTGFEEFSTGEVGEQYGWFATEGWSVEEVNPDAGRRHFRGTSQTSGTGEKFCITPYLFEYEEFYYPQYTTASMRLNLDKAKGTTWEIVPQDPWSYVATRLRFNADGTLDAMVIGNDYEVNWRRVPVTVPSGYFDLAIEYNNAGSDTSGFPTYYLFVNNQRVFAGTGLAAGIGQVAFVTPMESPGPIFDLDQLHLVGGEYIPPYLDFTPAAGTIQPGDSVDIAVGFDATIMKYGEYESDLVIRLDEVDSLVVPITLTVPGAPSLFRDTYAIYWVLEKEEEGVHDVYLKNDGGEPVTFDFRHDIPGLTVTPSSGVLQVREDGFVRIRFNGPPGIYQDEIAIYTSASNEPQIMPVNITRFDSGAVFTAPDSVFFQLTAGEKSSQTLSVANLGINTVCFTTELSPTLDPVISIDPAIKTIRDVPMDLLLNIDGTTLAPGVIVGYVQFKTNDPDTRNFYTHVTLNVVAGGEEHYVTREVWNGIRGREIASIPIQTAPDQIERLSAFESPSNTGDNYGARIRGYVQAPVTGDYTFYIASNDNSELWLSTDESEANKRKIASVTGYTNPGQWNKYPSQKSVTINLMADRKYYIEALHKEGVGTDHLAVGWTLPDGTMERPIPAIRLLPFETNTCAATGTITREFWTRVQGAQVSDIPVNRSPDGTEVLTVFEGPTNAGSNYGARIRGYICPPTTGTFYFWISSNDQSELWLSTDADPANKTRIAYLTRATGVREWDRFNTQKSAAIFLTQGKRYYIEALHKQGIGTDHFAVGWQLPDGTMERPIAGAWLSPYNATSIATMGEQSPAVYTDEEEPEAEIHAYPNPVENEQLTIDITQTASLNESEIAIRDITGLLVYKEKIPCSGQCTTEIDVRQRLVPGVYILQVNTGGREYTERLIVR